MVDVRADLTNMAYIFASVMFILSLAGLSNQTTSRKGNYFGMIGMFVAILITMFNPLFNYQFLHFIVAIIPAAIIGSLIAYMVAMTQMPQTVAAFHSFVGLGAVLVGISNYLCAENPGTTSLTVHLIEIFVGVFIGGVTFTGSIVAFGKLHGVIGGAPLVLFGWFRHVLNFAIVTVSIYLCVRFVMKGENVDSGMIELFVMTGLSFVLGWHLVMSIGGADMPVVVSMLNSYSGWACSASGFMLSNPLLIITGALVGSSGAILSYVMCEAMNRSFISVIAGGFGTEGTLIAPPEGVELEHEEIKIPQLVKLLKQAKNIIIVPGYGMAVSRCQNELASIVDILIKSGKSVRFCIHPVAGRLPGHMNVLLAEANVSYEIVDEMSDINEKFPDCDLALALGCNDIVNPAAQEDPNSVIAGMPVCEVWKSRRCIIFKRSLRSGYAGIENMLFYKKGSAMCFGDARDTMLAILQELGSGVQMESGIELDKVEVEEKKEEIEELKPLPPQKMTIGIVKENDPKEKRVIIVPSMVRKFNEYGIGINVEQGAGDKAGFTDSMYAESGAKIVKKQEAYHSDVVMKILPPTISDIKLFKPKNWVISMIWPAFNKELINAFAKANVKLFAIDQIIRTTRAQKMDVLSSQANLTGYRAVLEASTLLPRYLPPQMTAAGSFPPANMLIIGAGVAGLAAMGQAKKLGAVVSAFDTRPPCREQVESMGCKFLEVLFTEDGAGVGGYAKVMSPEFIKAEMELFAEQAPKMDVIITTALIPGKKSPILITKEMVRSMKPGSVIIDLGIREDGGNCELSKVDQSYIDEESGVNIVAFTDFPSRMAYQASLLLSHNMFNLVTEFGGENFALDNKPDDDIIQGAIVVNNGKVVWKPWTPPPQKPQEAKPKEKVPTVSADSDLSKPLLSSEDAEEEEEVSLFSKILEKTGWLIKILIMALVFCGIGLGTTQDFHVLFLEFVLAVIIGYYVIWNVTPALHTPLMSVTNAISGIIVLGSMLELHGPWSNPSTLLGIFGVLFASINIFGGFFVTARMLTMFHK